MARLAAWPDAMAAEHRFLLVVFLRFVAVDDFQFAVALAPGGSLKFAHIVWPHPLIPPP